MNRVVLIILIILALALIVFNVTLVDFSAPLQGDSTVAIIGIVASLCAIVLLLLYTASKKVQQKINED